MNKPDRPGTSERVKVAVLGTGSLGKEHVRIYAGLAALGLVDLVGVYDIARETARKCAEKYRVPVFDSVDAAVSASDAVSIVTPTTTHFSLTRQCLEKGRHVLVEKPMTDNAAQAADLVQIAQQHDCIRFDFSAVEAQYLVRKANHGPARRREQNHHAQQKQNALPPFSAPVGSGSVG